jgi:hypothetical protein
MSTQAHAADADDLPRRLHQLVLLEQVPAVGAEGRPVVADQHGQVLDGVLGAVLAGQLLEGDDQGRVADDPALPVDDGGQLVEGLHAVTRAGLGDVLLGPLALAGPELVAERRERVLDVEVGVPDRQVGHRRELTHGLAVGLAHPAHDRPALLGLEPAIPTGDLEAGRQPLHVPLERAGKRLVEVVEVEDQAALG